MKTKKNSFLKILVAYRLVILIAFSFLTYYILGRYQISIWWIVLFGSLLGVVFGKVFCRWMCPIGLIMEVLMKFNPNDSFRNMYQYHKIGCPIAWFSGLLNKVSILKIKVNKTSCISCGKCDKACYMPQINAQKYSLYKPKLSNPALDYTCSKCLKCVAVCPNGSITYSIK